MRRLTNIYCVCVCLCFMIIGAWTGVDLRPSSSSVSDSMNDIILKQILNPKVIFLRETVHSCLFVPRMTQYQVFIELQVNLTFDIVLSIQCYRHFLFRNEWSHRHKTQMTHKNLHRNTKLLSFILPLKEFHLELLADFKHHSFTSFLFFKCVIS